MALALLLAVSEPKKFLIFRAQPLPMALPMATAPSFSMDGPVGPTTIKESWLLCGTKNISISTNTKMPTNIPPLLQKLGVTFATKPPG
jgi:hypothetical protein